jgi:acetoin utilization deacetylase AcuC-like enzyme
MMIIFCGLLVLLVTREFFLKKAAAERTHGFCPSAPAAHRMLRRKRDFHCTKNPVNPHNATGYHRDIRRKGLRKGKERSHPIHNLHHLKNVTGNYKRHQEILMKISAITGPIFKNHDCQGHSECHDRLVTALNGMPPGITVHEPVPATREALERVHVPGYLTWLEKQCVKNNSYCALDEYMFTGGYMEQNQIRMGYIDPNTYVNPCSYEVATYAAGSAVAAVERALAGETCFALVRPPGHHAGADRAMGFCLLNNAAVAAADALTAIDRVAIVDWDVHHGNGTQNIFYGEDRVLYCSVHQKDTFPHTGFIEETGSGKGIGFTINAPLRHNSTIADYVYLFSEIFVPALRRYKPDLVIISAGQDVLVDDPVGCMRLEPADIGILTALIRGAGDFPLTPILEGGYGPSHAEAIRSIFGVLAGGPPAEVAGGTPLRVTLETVRQLKKIHGLP